MRPAASHIVLYVGGASARSAAAIAEVNRFCETLPGGFGIRVINVRSQADSAALDRRLTISTLTEHDLHHPGRLTRRQRAERAGRRAGPAEAVTIGVGP